MGVSVPSHGSTAVAVAILWSPPGIAHTEQNLHLQSRQVGSDQRQAAQGRYDDGGSQLVSSQWVSSCARQPRGMTVASARPAGRRSVAGSAKGGAVFCGKVSKVLFGLSF